MENIELFSVKMCWGNFAFDYVHSDSGVWRQTGIDLLIIAVYAPHDLKDKQMLWDYLTYEIGKWKWEVVIMGDFNEVRYKSDRFGSVFNVQGANVFNSFITNARLKEVPLGGSSFTWCHKSATKMSKLDIFFISKIFLNTCSNITVITLERNLSDHRPILLRESHFDYVPTPFRFFHHWIEMKGFSKFVEDVCREGPCDESNAMINMMIKLKYLKTKIRFYKPDARRVHIEMRYSKTLTCDQQVELESDVSNEEIKRAVWDCGIDKSPGPDFTFVISTGGGRCDKVKCAASKLECLFLKTLFSYLGSKVGGSMSRVHTWNEMVDPVKNRLSKWKMKTLSIGGKALKNRYSRIYSLETCNMITVGMKLAQTNLDSSFHRVSKGGVEPKQFDELSALVHDVTLTPMAETSSHLFFSCCMARQPVCMITRWWDVPYGEVDSYEDWIN
nr:RNA-directed DNA polymerase, eukaryota [Tanacetum cinerariifolium]